MPILSIVTDTTGQVNVNPRRVKIVTSDDLDTVISANYLNQNTSGLSFYSTDVFDINYAHSNGTGIYGVFLPVFDGPFITLEQWVSNGDVVFPVEDKHFVNFSGEEGQIQDLGFIASDDSQGIVAMSAGGVTIGNILVAADVNGTLQDGPVAGNKVLTSSIVTPDVGPNLVTFSVVCSAAALIDGSEVTLQAAGLSRSYRILNLFISLTGTNFSGGGGDRLLSITDSTTVYSVIPAADLQTLSNAAWGTAQLPYPAAAGLDVPTVAGALLVAKYSGGSTDYDAGSIRISGLLQRVA